MDEGEGAVQWSWLRPLMTISMSLNSPSVSSSRFRSLMSWMTARSDSGARRARTTDTARSIHTIEPSFRR